MNKHITQFLTVVSAVFLAQGANAQSSPQIMAAVSGSVSEIEFRDCGLYTLKIAGREDDAKSTSGKHTTVEVLDLVQETRKVPARLGVSFGCRAHLKGTPEGSDGVVTAVIRPPSGAKDAKSGTPIAAMRGERTYTIGGRAGYIGYTFRAENRLAPGTWTIEAWSGARKLADTAFEVGG